MSSYEFFILSPRIEKNRFLLAALLGSLTALAPLAMDMYLPALPNIARDFEASTALSQLSLMACLIGLALGQLIAGPISDTVGRRKPLMVGLIIFIAASLFYVQWSHQFGHSFF